MIKQTHKYLLILVVLMVTSLVLAEMPAVFAETGQDGKSYPKPDFEAGQSIKECVGRSLLTRLASPELVTVIVSLKDQPASKIAAEVKKQNWDKLRANDEEIRRINLKYSTGRRPANREEAARLAFEESSRYTEADRRRIREINVQSRNIKDAARKDILRQAATASVADQAIVADFVRSRGGSVTYSYSITNAIAARMPGNAIATLADHPLVRYVVEDTVSDALLNVSAPSISADTFWSAGETGGDWFNATCDTGVDTSHPALSNKMWWQGVFHATAKGDPVYDDVSTSTDDKQGHGTHVAGIMNSADATYRGIAYGSKWSTNLKAGFRKTDAGGAMYDSDGMAAVNWGLINASIDVINLSYGGLAGTDDDDFVRFWDAVVDDQSVLSVIAAGNDGSGDNTINTPSIHWNGLSVANVDDRNTTSRSDDIIASSSSRGPTPSGRKKPDISAPGTYIMAPSFTWEGTGADFVSHTGTSMAAPHVAGAATLLHDVGITDPRAVKAVLINTADYIQGKTTWSNSYGWGYINLDTAYLRRTNWMLNSVTPRNTTGWYKLYSVPTPQVGDKATMVWNREVIYNGASSPTTYFGLNDLNLKFYQESDNVEHSTSISTIDNVEQVVSNTTGPLVIRAYAQSTSFSIGTLQTYALAVPPGTVMATGPVLSAAAEVANYTPPINAKFLVRVRVANAGDIAAHNCTVRLTLPSGVSLMSGALTTSVGTADVGGNSTWAEIWLKATTTGVKTVTLSAATNSYGITDWTGSGSFTITPGAADTIPPQTIGELTGNILFSGGTDKILNGGFESSFTSWSTSGSVAASTLVQRTGTRSAMVSVDGSISWIEQTIALPTASSIHLEFWQRTTAGSGLMPQAGVSIYNSSGVLLFSPWNSKTTTSRFGRVHIDLSTYSAETIKVRFYSTVTGKGGAPIMYVDDVRLLTNPSVYTTSPTSYVLDGRDDGGSGMDSIYHAWDADSFTNEILFDVPTPDGIHQIHYRGRDYSANNEAEVSYSVVVDNTPPAVSLRIENENAVVGGIQRVTNGGFESGLTSWTTTGSAEVTTADKISGTSSLRIGNTPSTGSAYQTISIIDSRPIITFWYKASNTSALTTAGLSVRDTSGQNLMILLNASSNTGWKKVTADLGAFVNKTVQLYFWSNKPTSGSPPVVYFDGVSLLGTPTVYVPSANSESIILYEGSSGPDYSEYRIDSGTWIQNSTLSLSDSGQHTIDYRAADQLGNVGAIVTTRVNVDTTGPSGSIVINNSDIYTTSTNVSLALTYTDPVGVSLMRIQNDAGVWGSWQSVAASPSITFASGDEGVKRISVEFKDTFGNVSSTYYDEIKYIKLTNMSIAAAKMLPDGRGVKLTNKIASAIFGTSGYYYVSEPNRTSGIRVRSASSPISTDRYVTVEGAIETVDGEREIVLLNVIVGNSVTEDQKIKPLAMTNGALLGGPFYYQPGRPGGGLNNVGLLVKTTGRVVSYVGNNLYINDGSSIMDSLTTEPALLVDRQCVSSWGPPVGSHVAVTGISGVTMVNGLPARVIRPRNVGEIQIIALKAAFVYNTSLSDAQSFKSMLDSENATTTLVPYSSVGSTDLSKYHVILIGGDTGVWTDTAKVDAILGCNTPIIAIGNGGAKFLDAVPNLNIGFTNSQVGTGTSGTMVGGAIYNYPHAIGFTQGGNLSLYTATESFLGSYETGYFRDLMLSKVGDPNHYPVIGEDSRFYMWGFYGPPSRMTATGRDVFTNLVFRTLVP